MSRTTEERALLAEMADRLFGELAGSDDWPAVEENGITALFVAEADGGFGGGWEDAFVLLHAAGLHCLALPLAETLLARRWLAQAQIEAPYGPIAVASSPTAELIRDARGWRLSGRCADVPWGNAAGHLAIVAECGGQRHVALVAASTVRMESQRVTIACEPLADLQLQACEVQAAGVIEDDPLQASALLRAALMAGALSATLHFSVQHANERQQFGRPIGRFQAIQHSLALLANEVAAATCAALAACRAADRGPAEFEIAAAKLRANRAVGVATAIAHQVHGAMGFTMEHRLHRATQRLWTWRSEYGNDRYWAARLGGITARCGAHGLWPHLTALSDRQLDLASAGGDR